jgi:hypothetical protein
MKNSHPCRVFKSGLTQALPKLISESRCDIVQFGNSNGHSMANDSLRALIKHSRPTHTALCCADEAPLTSTGSNAQSILIEAAVRDGTGKRS